MKKRTYIYKQFERFWHWSQALLIFFLALTGFEAHSSYKLFGFENAVNWHNNAAWAFLILIIFAIFWHFVTGEWKQYIPTTKFIKAQVNYYITGIFKGAPHPTHKTVYNKFNPLQRFTYLGLKLIVIPVQVGSGILYLFFMSPNSPLHQHDIHFIAIAHTLGAFLLLTFVIVHVYLTTTGERPLTSIKAMITGWEVVHVDEEEERRNHLYSAVNESVAGYYRMDNDGKILDVNEAWLKMYKYDNKNQIIGQHYAVTRSEEDLPVLNNIVKKVKQGETIKSIVANRKCFDGSLGQHILSANPIYDNDQIVGMEGFVIDITALDTQSEHIYNAIKSSQPGYYRLDTKGYIEEVNEVWLSLYGYTEAEILGEHYSVTRTKEGFAELEALKDQVLKGQSFTNKIATRKCKDGSLKKHILSASPVIKNEKIVGMEGYILNLDEN